MKRLAVLAGVLVALALAWRLTPLRHFIEPHRMLALADGLRATPLSALLVPIAFVGLGLCMVPVNLLKVLTVVLFGPMLGSAYALCGIAASAVVGHELGARTGAGAVSRWESPRAQRIRDRLQKKGVWAVLVLRMIPLGPFTLVNAMAGAAGVRRTDFLIGTLLGSLPALGLLALCGEKLEQMVRLAAH